VAPWSDDLDSKELVRGNGERTGNEPFEAVVSTSGQEMLEKLLASAIVWYGTGNGEFPYEAEAFGVLFTVRINDFPAEPLYSILMGDQVLGDLEDWPPAWIQPSFFAGSA